MEQATHVSDSDDEADWQVCGDGDDGSSSGRDVWHSEHSDPGTAVDAAGVPGGVAGGLSKDLSGKTRHNSLPFARVLT